MEEEGGERDGLREVDQVFQSPPFSRRDLVAAVQSRRQTIAAFYSHRDSYLPVRVHSSLEDRSTIARGCRRTVCINK